MTLWKLKRWFNILLGRECRICYADLRRVETCGICKREKR